MRLAFLSWRDFTHPEGGGAEHYLETVAEHLAARGHDVTFYCAAHGDARATEVRRGVTFRRQGGRLTVYAAAMRALRRDEAARGAYDAVVDTQNGIPFFSSLWTRTPVVVLVHHVHREQWPVVFGPVAARVGWFIESRIAPRVYRSRQYVAVSGRTRDELVDLGVTGAHIAVIHNGTDAPLALGVARAADPTLIVLGRLVPHKRVEHAIDVVARLRPTHPGLRLRVVGHGWWHDRIAEHAHASGVEDDVALLGFVDETTKHAELSSAWVALAPSVKEGWGLCVVEAASHGVPTVAYSDAGGLSESIIDGRTGMLVDDLDAMTRAVSALLADAGLRADLGDRARDYARQFTWVGTAQHWEVLLDHVTRRGAPITLTDARSESVRG
ncbi:group 1 glycosyl transferase [Phycicoccus sp. Root563]|uniref:glycosyltransferase family 4 protein n=1 Tax=Phycicoccus sp. Root563 TaxID=1736562 RepID=UPI0007029413|nr:glycosyltransferase family 4 protein [Phycicoccus sp. Root563]KQZ88029.1 group 1 glycosyl transferase [Phycicoccus sp. Root563]